MSKILVVDDEPGMRASVTANLELEGYEVMEAADGKSAVELVKAHAFDLVLTDIRMPGIDGVDMFLELRRIRPELTVVMMTGFALEDRVQKALTHGVYTVVYKPFDMNKMLELVERALHRQTILVVEQAPGEGETLVTALKEVGLRAESVRSKADAERLLEEKTVDICVLDLAMAGIECVQKVLAKDEAVAVIATAHAPTAEEIHRAMNHGAYLCLRKPFDLPELVKAIAKARGARA